MFLAGLTWLQFLALFGAISAGVVALYLWDRSKRRVRVAALRFFTAAQKVPAVRRRRRIQQPLSLALQLLGIVLLLLALAQLRLGARGPSARNHVLILDTSAWMAARTARGTLMDQARLAAWAYIRALPASDRVMLVRADALATPATAFERNRDVLEQALIGSRPGSTALSLARAIEFARQAQRFEAGRSGEIVYAGAGRVVDRPSELATLPAAGVRVLPVSDALENCGLRRIGLRRSPADSRTWQVLVGARNYGIEPHTVTLTITLDGAPAGAKRLTLEPGAEANASFECQARSAGRLEARLSPGDAFPADDRAVLDLPAQKPLNIVVYSDDPLQLRPLLSNPLVKADYRRPADYRADAPADIVILDRFRPPAPPAADTIWIEPPEQGRPRVTNVALASWHSEHPISAGLKAKDLWLDEAEVLAPGPDQQVVAEVEAGPVILARAERPRSVVLGFHPVRGALRYELTTPLLFANILRWMAPDIFRHWELNAGSAGDVTVPLGTNTEQVRVVAAGGTELPYTLEGNEVRFFAAAPGTVRVIAGDREIVYSLILPQMGETRWTPPREIRRGAPRVATPPAAYAELWPWLAAAGALILMIEWMLFGRPRNGQGALLLKAASLLLAILALAQPELSVFESRIAVAILADTSASIPEADLARASSLAEEIRSHRGRNWTAVVPFAQSTRALSDEERKNGLHLRHTAGEPGNGTDLEAAVREGIAALPPGRVPRLALISDGRENLGSLARAAWQARQLGIPIDTYALAGRPEPDLHLKSVTLPLQAFTGERFPIDIVLGAPRPAEASVEISAGGKPLGSSRVQLESGSNHLRVHASLTTAGAVDLAGSISAPGLGSVRFTRAVTLRRPRVLLVSQDPPGTGTHLARALETGQFDVTRAAAPAASLDDFQIVVLNNSNLDAIPRARQAGIEQFVKQGGGLLVIGGERNVYLERRTETAMDRTLPARLAPPRTPEGTCVVLILDKSSSMEGRKMELARLAAVGVVENLRPTDFVGVLIFDNSFHWAVPIRRAEERGLIERVIAGISPDGGTQIAPALEEAYRRILPVNAIYKHIVLLTDGISEEGDSMALAREAAGREVTISTVGLGQDVNRAYLERVAGLAGGRSYFLSDPAGLEQILLRDVMEHTGSTAVERPIRPLVMKKAEILEGVGIETAPPLAGYVHFIAKPTAEVILDVDRNDPLYVRWQYGLGRAAIFSSDAKSRWARRWVSWGGFDRFWDNVFRDLLPHARAGEATAEYDSASDELVVDYRLVRQADEPAEPPDLFVFGPAGFQRPVALEKVAEGAWRGRVRLDRRQGLFRVRPLAESRAFPEVGFYREQSELSDYGSNEALLKQVAAFTGGRFEPAPRYLFDPGGRQVPSTLRLWPGLLALALLLNLIELVLRKWRALRRQPATLNAGTDGAFPVLTARQAPRNRPAAGYESRNRV